MKNLIKSVVPLVYKDIMKFIDIGANLTDAMYAGDYNGSNRHRPDLQVWCYMNNERNTNHLN